MAPGIGDIAYDRLPRDAELGLPHAWDALDRDLGTLARRTPEHLRRAAALVRDGHSLGLTLPLTEPDPPLFGRSPVRHEIFTVDRNTLDDRIDSLFPQGSSQWDGLRHIRARERGFFGGVPADAELAPDGPLGIDAWARTGIVGRGVLLDVPGLRRAQGRDYDGLSGETIEADDLAAAAEAQGVEIGPGDILCVRTGWLAAYRALDADGRAEVARDPVVSGLSGGDDMARYLWDSGICAVAADNPTLEVRPGDARIGSLHRRLIPMLGFVVGELLDLDELTTLCAADGRWDFLLVAVPLNLPGAVGSPANAVAIR